MPKNVVDQYDNLKDAWITYAKNNGIKVVGRGEVINDGRSAEDTDLAQFLQQQEFDPSIYQPLIDELPDEDIQTTDREYAQGPSMSREEPGYETNQEEEPEKIQPQTDIRRGKTTTYRDPETDKQAVYSWTGSSWIDTRTGSPSNAKAHNAMVQKADQETTTKSIPPEEDNVRSQDSDASPSGKLPPQSKGDKAGRDGDPEATGQEAEIDDIEDEFNDTDMYSDKDLDVDTINKMNRIKDVIKNKMTKEDRRALLRDLRNG